MKIQKKNCVGGPIKGLGWGGSKVWGRWLLWGMGDVNKNKRH